MKTHKTKAGTDLPLLNLRGKDYLEVKYRLVWFREDHPTWTIKTELISITAKDALAKATIQDEQGRILSTSHKFENQQGFADFIEKAETGAIGRALALIGYGTQFCGEELDEGKRLVDAPVDIRWIPAPNTDQINKALSEASEEQMMGKVHPEPKMPVIDQPSLAYRKIEAMKGALSDPHAYIMQTGKKYKGYPMTSFPKDQLEGYAKFLTESAAREGKPLHAKVKADVDAINAYLNAPSNQQNQAKDLTDDDIPF